MSNATVRDTFWAIAGGPPARPFLFTGTYFTRRDAINDHIAALWGTGLSKEKVRRYWRRRRRLGDRAIRVTVIGEVIR